MTRNQVDRLLAPSRSGAQLHPLLDGLALRSTIWSLRRDGGAPSESAALLWRLVREQASRRA